MVPNKSARRGLLGCAATGDALDNSGGGVTCSDEIAPVGGELLCPKREQ